MSFPITIFAVYKCKLSLSQFSIRFTVSAFLHLCSANVFLKGVNCHLFFSLPLNVSFNFNIGLCDSSFSLLLKSDFLSRSVALSVELKTQSSCTVHLVNKSNEYVAFKVCQQFLL
jgi:hypothetical protein